MSYFTINEVIQRALSERTKQSYRKSSEILNEALNKQYIWKTYDIFLSHSLLDSDIVLGIKCMLEDMKYKVYVDWIDDPELDRSNVTFATADKLRKRMHTSKSLFYLTTSNSNSSKWMPWECGFFDGLKQKVAILPIINSGTFKGNEYLGLYPECRKSSVYDLMIYNRNNDCARYDYWVSTPENQMKWT